MTLDANIVVAFLNGEEKIIAQLTEWREEGRPLLLPTVAEAEVLGYPRYSPEERENAARLIAENFVPLVCDRIIAHRAALLRASIKRLKLPDAIIAATALVTNTSLVSRDKTDFKNIPELMVEEI